MEQVLKDAETISLFCRINMNARRELPIRASEMGFLIFLVKHGEAPTPLEAARFFHISKPMVTAMIRPLASKGYLDKLPSPTDGRSFTLVPTEKARHLVDETYREYVKNIEMLRTRMGSANFDSLINLIGKANAILGEE